MTTTTKSPALPGLILQALMVRQQEKQQLMTEHPDKVEEILGELLTTNPMISLMRDLYHEDQISSEVLRYISLLLSVPYTDDISMSEWLTLMDIGIPEMDWISAEVWELRNRVLAHPESKKLQFVLATIYTDTKRFTSVAEIKKSSEELSKHPKKKHLLPLFDQLLAGELPVPDLDVLATLTPGKKFREGIEPLEYPMALMYIIGCVASKLSEEEVRHLLGIIDETCHEAGAQEGVFDVLPGFVDDMFIFQQMSRDANMLGLTGKSKEHALSSYVWQTAYSICQTVEAGSWTVMFNDDVLRQMGDEEFVQLTHEHVTDIAKNLYAQVYGDLDVTPSGSASVQ